MLNIIRDNKGSAVMLLGVLFSTVLFLTGLFVLEFRMLAIYRDKVNDALVGAELAALGTADREALSYGEVVLPEDEARTVFDVYLAENLQGVAAGPVSVDEFEVYNPGEYPTTCPWGHVITETAIHAVITVPVRRPVFTGLFGDTVEITSHKDSDDVFGEE